MSTRPTIHETMLSAASVFAQRSTCKRRQVGCILVDKYHRVLATGHNGVAKGQPHCIDTACPGAACASGTGLDLCDSIHAEQNALMFCTDVMKIFACYVTASPCVHCVKMLLNTSCQEIHFIDAYPHHQARVMWEGSVNPDSLQVERLWKKHG